MEHKLLSKISAPLKGKKQNQDVLVDISRFIESDGEKYGQPCLIRFEPISPKAAQERNIVATDYAKDSRPAYYVLKMRLKFDQILLASLRSEGFCKVSEDHDRYQNFCGLVAHTIKFGAFPCHKVDEAEIAKQKLNPTGKSFLQFNRWEEYRENPEFKAQDNQYYVRTKSVTTNAKRSKQILRKLVGLPEKPHYDHYKVEMMDWYVTNFNANNPRYLELESKYLYSGDQVYGLQGSVPGYVSSRFVEDMCVMSADFLKANGIKDVEKLNPEPQKQSEHSQTM